VCDLCTTACCSVEDSLGFVQSGYLSKNCYIYVYGAVINGLLVYGRTKKTAIIYLRYFCWLTPEHGPGPTQDQVL
jgi:hypothetical protein